MQNPFIDEITRQLSQLTSTPAEDIERILSVPPDDRMGDYAFPCFNIAKAAGRKPQELAEELAGKFEAGELVLGARTAGPYLNFFVSRAEFTGWVLSQAHNLRGEFGRSDEGRGQTVVIEFSSPNIAKHLGVHHIRSTMIGNSLVKIYKALGYRTVSINFLGDWGTQFGILMAAYRKWGDEKTLQGDAVSNLNELYVRYTAAAKEDPTLRDEGRAWFKRLEEGNAEAVELWQKFRQISLEEFDQVYKRLGVTFDVISGESLYDKLMPATIDRLEQKGLAVLDQGALIVDLKQWKMPPLLLRKSDGATLYDTRDMAAAEDRWEKHHFARMAYVVGGDQKLHFRQLFKALEMMGYAWAKDCVHVDFGVIRVKGAAGVAAKMSTRGGTMIMLKEVLDEAVERSLKAIDAKNPELKDKEQIARAVGIGAVVFNDLKRQRTKDVDFDWDQVLSFEGETGPYLQYAHVRLCSILRKYGKPVSTEVDFAILSEPEEFALAKALADFSGIIRRAADLYEPSTISQYLLSLCGLFSTFYHKHKVLTDDAAFTAARVLLVDALRQTIANGLALLGLQAPEEM